MEGWCKEMEREAEENDLSEESKSLPLPFPTVCRTGNLSVRQTDGCRYR